MQQHRPYWHMKVARYSFSGSIPAKFKHKLRRHKQTFGKIATTVVTDKDDYYTLKSPSVFSLAKSLQLILGNSATYRLFTNLYLQISPEYP